MRIPFLAVALFLGFAAVASATPKAFLEKHCVGCHSGKTPEAGLDLAGLPEELSRPENFSTWVKIHDRIASGEMPPPSEPRPDAEAVKQATTALATSLVDAERERFAQGRTPLRRLTRREYENTIRDLFELDGIKLAEELPADGAGEYFDKHADALDISHVNIAKYVAAADHTLDYAIATRPQPPTPVTMRTSLAYPSGFVSHVVLHGDGVLLENKKPSRKLPPANEYEHIDEGAHYRVDLFTLDQTVGLFRHEDESFHPYFNEFIAIYPGRYRLRTSLWSFQWDKGEVLPSRGTEAARLSVVSLTGHGTGGGHPSRVLTYLDAPSMNEQVHELVTWLNPRDFIGFNAASLARGGQTRGPKKAMGFTGPAIACDWFEYEGPIHEVWPPVSHQRLFGDLPLVEYKPAEHPGKRPLRRPPPIPNWPGTNRPDPTPDLWTVKSDNPSGDAKRLLAAFLPRAFRRPVDDATIQTYVELFERRVAAGDPFESAMRGAYRAALCSPNFLYHVEPVGQLDDHALACRLSYLLWNSAPDEKLVALAAARNLRDPKTLREQTERMLADPKSERLIEDFLGQWLKLKNIAANDPDDKLYPEFSTYLQDSMVAETKAFFRELLEKDLDARYLVQSDFAMLNEKLATHYGIAGVSGPKIRRVALPSGSPRGAFLTQAAILKVTADGTTTSPVPRGAFVMDRLLGQRPDPPPPNITAIEPDVRGATTIREQLDKHRSQQVCASCHAKIDPPGFALESFDPIGGFRDRYRSIGEGDPAPRGSIDPFIHINFKLGRPVDASGQTREGAAFNGIIEFQQLLAKDREKLLSNLAKQFVRYSTGRDLAFGDRQAVDKIVAASLERGGGVRTLLHEVIQSELFQTR